METPATEAQIAPQTVAPRHLTIERQGGKTVPVTAIYPRVVGGVCEFCGVLDSNIPSQYQYKLCPHFRGINLRCSYCPEAKNPDDVNYHSILHIHGHPDHPDKLVVVCDSYECSRRHTERYVQSL